MNTYKFPRPVVPILNVTGNIARIIEAADKQAAKVWDRIDETYNDFRACLQIKREEINAAIIIGMMRKMDSFYDAIEDIKKLAPRWRDDISEIQEGRSSIWRDHTATEAYAKMVGQYLADLKLAGVVIPEGDWMDEQFWIDLMAIGG